MSADPFGLAIAGMSVDSASHAYPDLHTTDPVQSLLSTLTPEYHDRLNDAPLPDAPPALPLATLTGLYDLENQDVDPANIALGPVDGNPIPARHELVFVDMRAPDVESLISDIQSNHGSTAYEVVIIDPDRDGVAQISNALVNHQGVDAVHIVSHGQDGAVQIGNEWLTLTGLTRHSDAISGWGQALSANADVLFYGCNLASSADGVALVDALGDLTGADVAASADLTGNTRLGGDWDLEYHRGTIETTLAFSDQLQESWTGALAATNPLWLTTQKDVRTGGQPGIDTWQAGDLAQIADPNLAFEQGGLTNGTVSIAFDVDLFASGANISGIHYVSQDITIGLSAFPLKAGDLLFSGDATTWGGNSALSLSVGFSNSIASAAGDVMVFRPDAAGDYSAGSFAKLLSNPTGHTLSGISLIEANTVVGDATLDQGDFLFTVGSTGGAGSLSRDVLLYQVTDGGLMPTSGATTVLLDGRELGLSKLHGVDLVEASSTVGGYTLNIGSVLLTTDASTVGSNGLVVNKHDVFALNVTATTMVAGAGNTAATAGLVFDGSDLGFDIGSESLDGLTLTLTFNNPPTVTTSGTPLTYTALDPATVIDPSITVTDSDSLTMNSGYLNVALSSGATGNDNLGVVNGGNVTTVGATVQVSGVAVGTIDAVNNGSNGNALLIHFNAASTPAAAQDVARQITYQNTAGTPSTATRIVNFVVDDGAGGTSIAGQKAISFTGASPPLLTLTGTNASYTENAAPVLLDPGATLTDADSANLNGGYIRLSTAINGATSDVLAVTSGGNVTLSGSNVLVSGNVIGTIDAFNNGLAGSPLWINLSSVNSTPAAVQEVVRQLSFSSGSDAPSPLTRSVSILIADGSGAVGLSRDQWVDVLSVNDAPSGANATVTTLEETAYTFSLADFGFSDTLDNNSFIGVKISALPTLGTLTNGGVAVNPGDVINTSDILAGTLSYTPVVNGVGAPYTSLNFQVQDSGGTANGGIDLSSANTLSINVTNINDVPTGSVTISGTATENQTLTAGNTLADADGLGTIGYQWQRNGIDITGATGSTYILGNADVGSAISVVASYTDGHGSNESVASAATTAVANINDAPTGSVTISGTATENQTLTAGNTLADADGLGTIGYQWQRNGIDITGATGSTYILGNADVGSAISAVASYTDGHGSNESIASAATTAVANINDVPTGSVTISGAATENQTLTAGNTLADADGLGTIGYQWQRNGIDITGATGSTYILGNADVGSAISVVASYTDGHGSNESVASAATTAVANINDAPTALHLSNWILNEGADTSSGVVVGTLSASDPDTGDTATYSIQGGTDAAAFSITNSNELTLTSGILDHAAKPSYDVVVRVTDSGGLNLDASFSITINPVAAFVSQVTAAASQSAVGVVTASPAEVTSSIVTPPTTPGTTVSTTQTTTVEAPAATRSSQEGIDERLMFQAAVMAQMSESDIGAATSLNDNAISENPAAADLRSQRLTEQATNPDQNAQLRAGISTIMKSIEIVPPGWNGMISTIAVDPLAMLGSYQMKGFTDELATLREGVDKEIRYEQIVNHSAAAATASLSVGYAAYLLRGGILLSSVLSSLPAWTFVDPAPILTSTSKKNNNDPDDESLESMVEDNDHETERTDDINR